MSYHKKNLKETIAEIAWKICDEESWQAVNMRRIAKLAGVSATSSYRHYHNKNDLKAEIMRRGFAMLYEGIQQLEIRDDFTAYGTHYIKFGLQHPHIYDLLFGNTDIDISLYPELEALSKASFDRVVTGVRNAMQNKTEQEVLIKSYHIWASVHGIVGILRRTQWQGNETETLNWIRENISEYLKITSFQK